MTTPEVSRHLSKSEPSTLGEGPVQDGAEGVPQGLQDKHYHLAAKPNEATDKPLEDDRIPAISEPEPRKNRVMSTGARTPNSLLAEIEAQVERNKPRRESEADAGSEGSKSKDGHEEIAEKEEKGDHRSSHAA